jgi:hypothetical protein
VWRQVRRGARCQGGIVGYPLEQLHEEVAYIAYHFHWSLKRILNLEHIDRRRWVEEISKINQRLNGEEAREETPNWSVVELLRQRLGQQE